MPVKGGTSGMTKATPQIRDRSIETQRPSSMHIIQHKHERRHRLDAKALMAICLRPMLGGIQTWIMAMIGILLMIGLFSLLIHTTGSAPLAYLSILPVILSAAIFKVPGGLIAAVIAGVSLGPWIPSALAFEPEWTARNISAHVAMFMIIGAFTGSLSTIAFIRHQRYITRERIDPVTGLLSPTAIIRMVAGIDKTENLPFTPTYALVIAFEGLGSVMRALGIQASNKAIFEIGTALQNAAGDIGIVTRIHGSTYGVLLPPGSHSIGRLASRLQDDMPNTIPLDTFSLILLPRFGVAKITEDDRMTGQPFRKAMAALNQARRRGTRVGRYSSAYDERAKSSLMLISEFDTALRNGGFEVYFQPKIELATARIVGVEALIRWQTSPQGEISPATFIPLIERTNLIDPMTRFVAERSFESLASWNAMGLRLDLALNLPPTLLRNAVFINYFKRLPQQYGIDPSQVEVEVTETALMDDMMMIRRVLEGLREQGFRISIDDFGTGYSSMKYLKVLPIHTVKLDKSFVQDLPHNAASAEIAAATASMCKRMNYKVVAEGVETQAAMTYLLKHGFDIGQGYYFSKPLPARDLMEFALSEPKGYILPGA